MSILRFFRDFASAHGLVFEPGLAPDGEEQASVYSQDGTKRYAYARLWQPGKPVILWVMLNPGTGDAEMRRRKTLERCKQWSKDWGYGCLVIGNVFATRTKSAKLLGRVTEYVDEMNSDALRFLRDQANELSWHGVAGGARSITLSTSNHCLLVQSAWASPHRENLATRYTLQRASTPSHGVILRPPIETPNLAFNADVPWAALCAGPRAAG